MSDRVSDAALLSAIEQSHNDPFHTAWRHDGCQLCHRRCDLEFKLVVKEEEWVFCSATCLTKMMEKTLAKLQ